MKLRRRFFLNSVYFSFYFVFFRDCYNLIFFKKDIANGIYGSLLVPLLCNANLILFSNSSVSFFFQQKKDFKTFFALVRSFLNFMAFGYFADLTLKGKGYYNFSFSNFVALELGYSHRVLVPIPSNVVFRKFKYRLGFFSFDFESLFNFVHCLLNLKKLNIYKGKGIYFRTTQLNLKVGKKR